MRARSRLFALSCGIVISSWGCGGKGSPSQLPGPDGGSGVIDAGDDGGVNRDDAGGTGSDPEPDGGGVVCAEPLTPIDQDPARAPEPDPALAGQTHQFFTLRVEDKDGNPLRGAQLTTVTKVVLTTDDNGVAAFYEPGLMGQRVYFHVTHPGYEHPADGFGNRGGAVEAVEGGSATFVLERKTGDMPPPQGDLQSRLLAGPVPTAQDCFAFRFVDAASGRGVPLVRVQAFAEEHWSDSQGFIAYCHPDHLDETVNFEIFSYGYGLPGGWTSASILTERGGSQTIALERKMVAERLYRITGTGIYRDSVLLGLTTPLEQPLLNGLVAGSDTAATTIYRGKVFWIWQDTDRIGYPLGNFRGTSAVSDLEQAGGLSPHVGVNLTYFVNPDGFAKPISEDFPPQGPVWMAGLVSLPDATGEERLFASYVKVEGLNAPLDAGVMRFDDETKEFKRVVTNLLEEGFVHPDGHAFKFAHDDGEYVYYPGRLRIPATAEAIMDRTTYEQFSPYGPDNSSNLMVDTDGKLDYAFRPNARHVTSELLRNAGIGREQDLDGHDVDIATGKGLVILSPSVVWNPYRQRFLRISQALGPMGDLYHAEADTPMGPWVYAQRVIEHPGYTFYNPFHHPEFDQDGGRVIFLEATYVDSFTTPKPVPTPRYNYNQVMYRLALDDPRLTVPVAFYQVEGEFLTNRELSEEGDGLIASFFAYDRPAEAALPVAWSGAACEPRTLELSPDPKSRPLFYAFPPDATPSSHHVALYEYRHPDGRRVYDTEDADLPEFERQAAPLAYVWKNPVRVKLPVRAYLAGPLARAGEDQCVTEGTRVTLDGSQSKPGDAPLVRYVWSIPNAEPCAVLEGEKVTVDLPRGLHSIELTVIDERGRKSSDTVLVRVD